MLVGMSEVEYEYDIVAVNSCSGCLLVLVNMSEVEYEYDIVAGNICSVWYGPSFGRVRIDETLAITRY